MENSLEKDVNWNELMIKKEVVHQNEESLRAEVIGRKGHKKGKENALRKILSITHKKKIIEKQKEKLQQAENIMTMKYDTGYEPPQQQPPPGGAIGSTETEPVSSADSLPDLVPIENESENVAEKVADPNDKVVASLLDEVNIMTKTEIPSGLFFLDSFHFLCLG